ncbi:HTH-type transcriptional repressor Bm3R1 [Nocardioides dokdonensis FR1436]|uniref:HTH-type transcriptional repressor Bm3R1 n=1 Tax=Nocardioides dokdonensis FR1436 TaxID=1300347 RepID=A0A1A9GM56_9ACTN|nr:TetR family transcriptional regulator [Nocardioides dokdonensis]ANH39368.1 HTH-type transcriptional repressor Bm3R1 [Nocardioides dokdonensis FR1436]
MTEENPGLRERRKASTRRALEDAALELFARDGFDATTIETIAAAADVSPRTFFRYFASKDDVVNPQREARQAQLRDEVRGLAATLTDLEAAAAAFAALCPSFEAERDRMLLRRQAAATSPALRGRMQDVVHSWQRTLLEALAARRGVDVREVEVQVAAATAVALWQTAIMRWLSDDGAALADELAACFSARQV